MTLNVLMTEIEKALPAGGDWCSALKARTLATLVATLRPSIVVEIGVWMGGSAVPIALALRHVGHGKLVAIDPWDAEASIIGEVGQNAKWWKAIDHDAAYQVFMTRLDRHDLVATVEVMRRRSDDVTPPPVIDLLHLDGNHTLQAMRDTERFVPNIRLGGILWLDDVGWEQGHVGRALELAQRMGFEELYRIDTGAVLIRREIHA